MSCLAIAKKRTLKLVLSLVLCGAIFSSGCWGLIIHGLPTNERNRGPINWGVVILDLWPFCIPLVIDLAAGSIRRPSFRQMERGWTEDYSAFDKRTDEYQKLGYRLTDEPLTLPKVLKLNVSQEDVAKHGSRQLKVIWCGDDGTVRDLFAGSVSDARGKEIAIKDIAPGTGKLEVCLEGQPSMAWNARAAAAPTCLAGR